MYPLQAGAEGAQGARPTFWQIGPVGEVVFYYLAAVAIAIFLYGLYDRFARYARGEADHTERLDDLVGRLRRAVRLVGSNEAQFDRDRYAGLMHTFVLWGFLTLLVATTILGIDMDIYRTATGESFFVGDFYLAYSLVADGMGLLFVVGVGMAIYRRYVTRNERLWGKHTSREDDLFVWSLFLLGVGGYLTEGVRMLGTRGMEAYTVSEVSFVGWFVMGVLDSAGVTAETAAAVYPVVWWSHALLALAFVATVPYAKPFHMISSFANVVTHDEDAGRRLPGVPADLDATSAESLDDFSWRQLLDQDACTKCGRCSSVCPAKASGRPLDPRDVILDLKSYREERAAGGEQVDIVADGGTSVVDAHTMESCMSCMACMDACPVDIEHLTTFTDLNRELTDSGEVDSNMQDVFDNVMRKGNTFGENNDSRGDWVEETEVEVADAREESVEYLWYVGDYPSFDDRNRKVARSLAAVFDAADVEFGIMFEDELYDGNDIRRVGEELLYVDVAGRMVESFEDCEFDAVVCTDPHSYNTFQNEYPEVDFEEYADDPMMEFDVESWDGAEVHHWTQVVEELVNDGRLGLSGDELDYTVTYHDPCHLGRYNDEYEAPRELVRATGCELVEMPRNREDSFCCGGGGGGMWMDFEDDPKPSEERMREALEDTSAGDAVEKFVVACPQCMTMYEDGRKTGGYEDDIEVVDVAELLVEAVDAEAAAGLDPATAD
jgi:Fe-S oxidoreductase/nitrate reductase gamma subunit